VRKVAVENISRDIHYAIRLLVGSPRFAIVAIVTLGLGIGVNTAVFSVMNAVVLQPLRFKDPACLLMVWDWEADTNARTGTVSYPDFVDWRRNNHVFEEMAAYTPQSFNLAVDEESERIGALRVSAELFDVLQAYPEFGRSFEAGEQETGRNHVAVISQGLWQRRFGARESVIGEPLRLDAVVYTVVGILPPDFQVPPTGAAFHADVFVPLVGIPMRGAHNLRVIARLKQGVRLGEAQADMNTVASQLAMQYPETNANRGVNLVTVYEQVVGDVRLALLALMGAVGFVLLISCSNVSSLILARGAARQRELGIRAALGAGRRRLIQQLLTESLVLAVLGSGLGLLLTLSGMPLLVAIIPSNVPRAQDITLNSAVLAFTVVVSILAGVACGIAPALQFSKPNINEALMERAQPRGFRRNSVGSVLVVAQVALASILLIGAWLMIKSIVRLQRVDPGFTNLNVLTMALSLPRAQYSQPQLRADFFRRVIEGTAALPGVESAGVINTLPLTDFDQFRSITLKDYPRHDSDPEDSPGYRVISTDYLRIMGVPLLAGRAFTERDNLAAPGVVIINDTMARHFWPDGDALGKRLTISPDENPIEIVGVVGSVSHHGLDAERGPELYVPYLQRPELTSFLVLRLNGNPSDLIPAVREQVRSIDRGQPVYNVMTMAQRAAESVAPRRFSMLLLSIFAALALVIALAGIFGLVSYSVARRSREIGVRIALGAQPHDVLRPLLREGMTLVITGLVIGLFGALGLTRAIANQLFDVAPTDLTTFVGAAVLLASVALIGTYIPARKATRVDPSLVLRSE
jgi:putative ABC transport system permease protein